MFNLLIAPVQSHPLQIDPLEETVTAMFHSVATPSSLPHSECPRFTTVLSELSNRAHVAAKWEDIGSFLQLDPGLLDIIRKDNPNDCRACFREMLKEWMKQVDPPPTWSAIITAVRDCGEPLLARTLSRKYLHSNFDAKMRVQGVARTTVREGSSNMPMEEDYNIMYMASIPASSSDLS